jgi:hypothetical protein
MTGAGSVHQQCRLGDQTAGSSMAVLISGTAVGLNWTRTVFGVGTVDRETNDAIHRVAANKVSKS